MTTPTTIKAEYLRAFAAEKVLTDALVLLTARVAKLEPPPPPPPPAIIPTGKTLQQIIDGVQAGGSVDLTGWKGTGAATIIRPITIKGGSTIASSGDLLTVNAKGVTLDSLWLDGQGTAYEGIRALHADGLQVVNCQIHDFVYAGVMVLETVGGQVSKNLIQRIGVGGANGANAYGIAFSDLGGPATADFTADSNVIEDVPTWEGIDTHNGLRLTWTNNITRRVRRPYWVNASGGKRPKLCIVKFNRAESAPVPIYDPGAFLVQQSDACEVSSNSMSLDYPVGTDAEWHNFVRDFAGLSTGLVAVGNVRS